MASLPRHEIADLEMSPGELSFEARIGGDARRVWMRSDSAPTPGPEAALPICLMPAMRFGGSLEVSAPLSPKLMRGQREIQAIQRTWAAGRRAGEAQLHEVDVRSAGEGSAAPAQPTGRVATFFSGGVDSWATVLGYPEVTDLIFVRGFDLWRDDEDETRLTNETEERMRWAAGELGLTLHVLETNLRDLSQPLVDWILYFGCATAATALFFEPLFDRVLIAGDSDYETQAPMGANFAVDRLWSTERLEIADACGRRNRIERTAAIAGDPLVRRTLRVCWQNPGGAYNCGRCRKCLMTMVTLEALGLREGVETFPDSLDFAPLADIVMEYTIILGLWEDVLDAARAARRADLEGPLEALVSRSRRALGLAAGSRQRHLPGPPPTTRIAVVIPVYRQAQYLAGAVASALEQQIETGVGVVIVNDGCPDPETDRIGRMLRDAEPDRVAYLHQPNAGLSAARNAGIRRALALWPHVEAIFPLDADNMLSPGTLADLRATLAERPEAAWASPTLEFFGAEEGEWRMPDPYLVYRQLFANQSDAGSLVRRDVFAAGIEFDETMTEGFEDWEFFLHAGLAGFRGIHAGRCGFRYRRRTGSMLVEAQGHTAELEAGLRRRHADAYRPGELARREHAEAPRFGLIRCDRDDVLLTAACDLEPHRVSLEGFLRPRPVGAGAAPLAAHMPAISVLTTAAAIEWLVAEGRLAETLLELQLEVHDHSVVGLRCAAGRGLRLRRDRPDLPFAALALRTRGLARLLEMSAPLDPEATVAVPTGRRSPPPLPAEALASTLSRLKGGLRSDLPVIRSESHADHFEHRHVNLLETVLPSTAATSMAEPGSR